VTPLASETLDSWAFLGLVSQTGGVGYRAKRGGYCYTAIAGPISNDQITFGNGGGRFVEVGAATATANATATNGNATATANATAGGAITGDTITFVGVFEHNSVSSHILTLGT
jgi:hypothetical protein